MRLLHVIPSVSKLDGGPSNAIWQMIDSIRLADEEIEITVLTSNHGAADEIKDLQAKYESNARLKLQVVSLTTIPYKVSLRGAAWLLRNVVRFDVVHSHAMFSFLPLFACFVARIRRVPYIMRPLGTLNSYGLTRRRPIAKRLSMAVIEKPLLRRASSVHCTSDAEVGDVRALCLLAETAVIPLAVPRFVRPREEAISAFVGAHRGKFAVLFLSRLDPKKNVECLLEAFALVRKSDRGIVLIIAGDGDPNYVALLRRKADALSLPADIIWTGHIEGERKAAAFSAANLFVLPSHSENFGVAAAEALSAGLPCVLSNGVAISQQVSAYGAGIAVDPNAQALAQAITKFKENPRLRTEASAAALRLAEEVFSSEAIGARLLALYRRVRRHT
jgi:glycosyltransferase involved in cell wall biosynthesis